MRPTDTNPVAIWAGTGLTSMARLLGNAGTPITPASVASVLCQVWDAATGLLVATPAVTAANVYGALVTGDPRWVQDSLGYNFLHTAPASCFPSPGRLYRVAYLFTPLSGEPFGFGRDVQTEQLLSGGP